MCYGQVWYTNINMPHQTVLISVCYDFLICFTPFAKNSCLCRSAHTQTHTKSVPTLRQPCPPNRTESATACVCVCLRIGGPSALLLDPRLKQCQQVCDETSQTIPHLSLSFPFWLSSSHCPLVCPIHNSATSFCLLSTIFSHYLSLRLTDTHSVLVVSATVLFSPVPPISIYTSITILYLFLALFLSILATHQCSINHFGPRLPDLVVSCDVRAVSCVLECTSDKAIKTEDSSKNT